jgi:hypothetical protein
MERWFGRLYRMLPFLWAAAIALFAMGGTWLFTEVLGP